MGKSVDKKRLEMEIKAEIRDLVNGRKIVKNITGKKEYKVYYIQAETIKALGEKFIDYFDLEDYVKVIDFHSFDPTRNGDFAYYKPSTRTIMFDYLTEYNRLTSRVSPTVRNNPNFAAKVNLRVLVTLVHELIHAQQVKIALIENSFEADPKISILYRIIYRRKREISKLGKKYDYYWYNPMEREAYIRSNRFMAQTLAEIQEDLRKTGINYFDDIAQYDALIDHLNRVANRRLMDDYNPDNPMERNAFSRFMEGTKLKFSEFDDIMGSYLELMHLIKEDLIKSDELSHDDKLVLGLPVKQLVPKRKKTGKNHH